MSWKYTIATTLSRVHDVVIWRMWKRDDIRKAPAAEGPRHVAKLFVGALHWQVL